MRYKVTMNLIKSKKLVVGIVIVGIVSLLLVGGIYFYNQEQKVEIKQNNFSISLFFEGNRTLGENDLYKINCENGFEFFTSYPERLEKGVCER